MKAIYIGAQGKARSFYTQLSKTNVKGYSKEIEQGDMLVFDKNLETRPLLVESVTKRNYNGVFDNPEDAVNAFFDAKVIPINDAQLLELRKDAEFTKSIVNQYI